MVRERRQPLVSIIIPFYDGKEWLIEALESVYNQSYKNIEIILINDGSKENIEDILSKYNDIHYIEQENSGAAVARNNGIKLSNGEYIAFLDADDIWIKEKLEIQINQMIKFNYIWSHTSYIKFDKNSENIVSIANFNGYIFPISIISNPIATPSVIIKKVLLSTNEEYKFAEGLKYGEDTILWYKLSETIPILAIDIPLVKVRMRGTNAASLAYSQIVGRNNLWINIISSSKRKMSLLSRVAYRINAFILKIINFMEPWASKNKIELISKIFYLFPWILFKIEKKVQGDNDK